MWAHECVQKEGVRMECCLGHQQPQSVDDDK